MSMAGDNAVAQGYDRVTYKELARLAKEVPEAAVQPRQVLVHNRPINARSPIGKWLSGNADSKPWYSDFTNVGSVGKALQLTL